MAELESGSVVGNYRVIRLLGKGGMGAVYEVEHVELGTHYALKTFTYDKADDYAGLLLRKFREEAKILSRINHPRVSRAFDLTHDVERGILYYVMSLVLYKDGESYSLDEVDRESLDEDLVYVWFCDACEALDHIHALGIVHRDVKLQNFLIDSNKHAVLADFGVSRIFGAKMKQDVLPYKTMCIKRNGATEKTVLGSDHYIAPEVASGHDATPAADAYGLGVMLFKLFTDKWADDLSPAKVDAQLHGYKYRWYKVIPQLIEFDPARRPARLADLIPLLERAPVAPAPAGPERAAKPRPAAAVRPRGGVGVVRILVALFFLAAFAAGAAWFGWHGFREYNAEQSRRLAEQRAELERKIAEQNAKLESGLAAEKARREAEEKRIAEENERARRAREEAARKKADAERIRIASDGGAPVADGVTASSEGVDLKSLFLLDDENPETDDKKDLGPIPDKKYEWLKGGRPDSPNNVRFFLSNGAVIDLVPMKAATFFMSNDYRDGQTCHKVTITRPFWISKFILTAEQCRDFAPDDYEECRPIEKALQGTGYTVSKVLDRRQFDTYCAFLSEKYASQLPKGYVFRLPTEAEWEYAIDIDNTDRLYEDKGGRSDNCCYGSEACKRSMSSLRRAKNLDSICEWAVPDEDGNDWWGRTGGFTRNEQIFVGGRMKPYASGVYDMILKRNAFLDVVARDEKKWYRYNEEDVDPLKWLPGVDIYSSGKCIGRDDWERNRWDCWMDWRFLSHIVLGPDLISEYPQRQSIAAKEKPPRKQRVAMRPERWKPDATPRRLNHERKFGFGMDNGAYMEFCLCPAGSFLMSNIPGQSRQSHRVRLTHPFLISKYNVTAAQWRDFGRFDCEGVPRELEQFFDKEIRREKWSICVKRNYWQWKKFCEYLTERYRAVLPDGYVFRLPTEAELERAMLADEQGTVANLEGELFDDHAGHFKDALARLLDKRKFKDRRHFNLNSGGWYRDCYIGGRTQANAWGVCDFRQEKMTIERLDFDWRINLEMLNSRADARVTLARDIVYGDVEAVNPLLSAGRRGRYALYRDGWTGRRSCHWKEPKTLAHIVIGPDVMSELTHREEEPYPAEDFGGVFIGDGAKVAEMSSVHEQYTNTPERHRLLLSRENVIVREKDKDEDMRCCHTQKEDSPWILIDLGEPVALAGIQVDTFRDLWRARHLRIWVSDGARDPGGRMKMRLVAEEDRELQRFRFDLNGKNVKAKFIRIGREPGFSTDYFSLNKVLIYGKKQ